MMIEGRYIWDMTERNVRSYSWNHAWQNCQIPYLFGSGPSNWRQAYTLPQAPHIGFHSAHWLWFLLYARIGLLIMELLEYWCLCIVIDGILTSRNRPIKPARCGIRARQYGWLLDSQISTPQERISSQERTPVVHLPGKGDPCKKITRSTVRSHPQLMLEYSMRHAKRATPPFYSLKANFWDVVTCSIYCQFI